MMLRLLLVCVLVALPTAVLAELNFPLPEFFTSYEVPGMTTPGPRAQIFSYVDLAVLFATLGLAAYLALRLRSRRHIVALVVFALLYFGFYRQGCICSIGAIQNVALSLGNQDYALPLVVGGFFLLPLLFALFFGRVFCAAVCPLGAAQDLVLLRPVNIPLWLENSLGLVPFFYVGAAVLYAATGSRFIICELDPFISFFRLGGGVWLVGFGVLVLLVATVVGRPYCRFLCPYAVLLRLLAPFAKWQAVLNHGECAQCYLCADACPFGAIKPPTATQTGRDRREGKGRLAVLVLLLPVLVAAGAWLGYESSAGLSRLNPRVSLSERIWLEEQQVVQGTTEQTEAFYELGEPNEVLYLEAAQIRKRFDKGAPLLGGWVALVIGLRLIGLSIRRRRERSEIDAAACVVCGRCFDVCPVERERVQKLGAVQAGV